MGQSFYKCYNKLKIVAKLRNIFKMIGQNYRNQ